MDELDSLFYPDRLRGCGFYQRFDRDRLFHLQPANHAVATRSEGGDFAFHNANFDKFIDV